MPSRVIPLEDLRHRSVMFWLPPGGRDNGVWSDTWVIIAEIENAYSASVLTLLAEADIGGYIATPGGRKAGSTASKHLYVDREQHHRATDVLMLFLRGKVDSDGYVTRSTPGRSVGRAGAWRSIRTEPIATIMKVLLVAAFIALTLIFVYYAGPQLRPGVHRGPHHALMSDVPGLTGVRS